MMQEVKLFISYPSGNEPDGGFVGSLSNLLVYLSKEGIKTEGYKLEEFTYRSWGGVSCLPMVRQGFVDEMIEMGYTHWLSLDDDMTFPMDIVDRLLSNNKDVVSCNARLKMHDINVYRGSCVGLNGHPVDSSGKTGLEEIHTMGGAIFLAKIDAFKHIKKPHFQVKWLESMECYVGEDVEFAALLRINGVILWCDHDTSQHIGHIGKYVYKWPEVKKESLKIPVLLATWEEPAQAYYDLVTEREKERQVA